MAGEIRFEHGGYTVILSDDEGRLPQSLRESLPRLWERREREKSGERCENSSGVVE